MNKTGHSGINTMFRLRSLTHEYLNEAMLYLEKIKKMDSNKEFWKYNLYCKNIIIYSFFSVENYIKRLIINEINNSTFTDSKIIFETLFNNPNFKLNIIVVIPLLFGTEIDRTNHTWGQINELRKWRNKIVHCVPGEGYEYEKEILTLKNCQNAIKFAKNFIKYLANLAGTDPPKIISQSKYEEII